MFNSKGKSKKILVTGAGTGIGRDTVRALSARGHNVVAATYSQEQKTLLQAENLKNVDVLTLDIRSPSDRQKIIGMDLDVLINNAAIGDSGSLAEVDLHRVRDLFEVNLFSALALTQLCIHDMVERRGGTIIFISSIAGRIPTPFLMPYGMTKFALSAAAAGLRKEMKVLNRNIHVSVVEPGAISTGFNQSMADQKFRWMKEGSLFSAKQIDALKRKEAKEFRLVESKDTGSVTSKIVKAAEARKPRLRYVAPWNQALAVRLARIFGV